MTLPVGQVLVGDALKAPFPWFGGKRKVADLVWERFGDVNNYVEPFAGSLAVMLGRPTEPRIETVNDLDCLLSNFWRALQADPGQTAHYADWPVNEADLIARHIWLVNQKEDFALRLQGDPSYYDAKVAGWWVWGLCSWIGSGWCSGNGPWSSDGERLIDARQLPHLSRAGQGVNRQRPHLGNAGQGVNRQLPHLGDAGQGVNRANAGGGVTDYFARLAERLRNVRVCCGDFARVLGPSVTYTHGVTGVFLDPPYAAEANRTSDLYAEDCLQVAHRAREWAVANGDNPQLRIALCGYDGEHALPDRWTCVGWYAGSGYSGQSIDTENIGRNGNRERVWFSPHCRHTAQQGLDFAGDAA